MRIRKIQFAPVMRPLSRHPCTIVRKDFMFSPGQLELEAVLDKQVKRDSLQLPLIHRVVKVDAKYIISSTPRDEFVTKYA